MNLQRDNSTRLYGKANIFFKDNFSLEVNLFEGEQGANLNLFLKNEEKKFAQFTLMKHSIQDQNFSNITNQNAILYLKALKHFAQKRFGKRLAQTLTIQEEGFYKLATYYMERVIPALKKIHF